MSERHPIIAITGSSGAGTTSVTRTFENIFRREKITAAVIEGDSFHRHDSRCNEAQAHGDESGPRLARQRHPLRPVRFRRRRACAGTLDKNWAADLVHANDWQAALTPAYLAWKGSKVPSILTIHNLAYQGLFPKELAAPDRRARKFLPHRWPRILRQAFVPQGRPRLRLASDHRQRDLCEGNHDERTRLRTRRAAARRSDAAQLTGILNGIDESWDPRACAATGATFGAGDWQGKQANADYVRKQFGLALSRGPIFALVARLVHQKGVDLVLSAADEIIEPGGQIVVTGSGEPQIEQALVDAHRRRPDAIGVVIGFNDGQARRIFAGSDFTLMPSRFEPCGLSQMYAQRFGSLPIGHQTGGLAETIKDGETGFLFSQPSAESFLGGVRRAFETFRAKDRLDAMRRSAMARSFSWDLSAACYSALYRKTIAPSIVA